MTWREKNVVDARFDHSSGVATPDVRPVDVATIRDHLVTIVNALGRGGSCSADSQEEADALGEELDRVVDPAYEAVDRIAVALGLDPVAAPDGLGRHGEDVLDVIAPGWRVGRNR